MTDINYSDLDPGIRETVRWLRYCGFQTTDSGDGVTKEQTEDTWDTPHVFIHSTGERMVPEANLLKDKLTMIGLCVEPVPPPGVPGIWIQANYDPANESATIMLSGVNDHVLVPLLEQYKTKNGL